MHVRYLDMFMSCIPMSLVLCLDRITLSILHQYEGVDIFVIHRINAYGISIDKRIYDFSISADRTDDDGYLVVPIVDPHAQTADTAMDNVSTVGLLALISRLNIPPNLADKAMNIVEGDNVDLTPDEQQTLLRCPELMEYLVS